MQGLFVSEGQGSHNTYPVQTTFLILPDHVDCNFIYSGRAASAMFLISQQIGYYVVEYEKILSRSNLLKLSELQRLPGFHFP